MKLLVFMLNLLSPLRAIILLVRRRLSGEGSLIQMRSLRPAQKVSY